MNEWKKLKAGTVKRIHVDRRIMAQNAKSGEDKPYYTIQTSKGSIKARVIEGFFRFDQEKPRLNCGARAYGETRGEIRYK